MSKEELTVLQKYIKEMNLKNKEASDCTVYQLFERIVLLESQFTKLLKNTKAGNDAYMAFVKHILESDRGLINVRPFFRLRETEFKPLYRLLEKKNTEALMDYPINFPMCQFLINHIKNPSEKILDLFNNIKTLRDILTYKFLQLALIKAKSFNKTSSSSYSVEDLVQIANEAVIVSIDKYVQTPTGDFSQVVLGRIFGHLINNGSNLYTVSIGASANKKLYRIKKALDNNPNLTAKQISVIIKVSESEVSDLLAATLYMSLDSQIEDTNNRYVDQISYDEDSHDNILAHNEESQKALGSLDSLDVIEKKLLVLMGSYGYKDYINYFHDLALDEYTVIEKKILILKGELEYADIR